MLTQVPNINVRNHFLGIVSYAKTFIELKSQSQS